MFFNTKIAKLFRAGTTFARSFCFAVIALHKSLVVPALAARIFPTAIPAKLV
jgi:hypothetical protein